MHIPHLPPVAPGLRRLFPGNSFNPPRPVWRALRHGWRGECPRCGAHDKGHACTACGYDPRHARIQSATALFAIPVAFASTMLAIWLLDTGWDMLFEQELLLIAEMIVALALASALVCELVPRIARALAGLQWALWMEGFDPNAAPQPIITKPERNRLTGAAPVSTVAG